MPKHPATVSIDSFKGINNVLSPESTPLDYLKKALNVNIDKQGKISKRKGYTLESSGLFTTLWSNPLGTICFVVKDNSLYEVNSDFSLTLLKTQVPDKIYFEEVDDTIYFTSKSFNGIIETRLGEASNLRTWGLAVTNSPTLSIEQSHNKDIAGSLSKGTYQVSYTYVDESGLESGSSPASFIHLDIDNSSIRVEFVISSDSRVVSQRIYCSSLNGNMLYFLDEVSSTTSNYVIESTHGISNPLRTFNLSPAPFGDNISYYKGRIYISVGDVLYYSEPNQYEFFNLSDNFLFLSSDILDLMPVEDGIWIGTKKGLYLLQGKNPDEFKLILREKIQIVKGTPKIISGSYFTLDGVPTGYRWLVTSDLGIYILSSQGVSMNLTSTNLSLERSNEGTSVFLQDGGIDSYLSILNKNYKSDNSITGDMVTTSVIRNGINIG